MTEKLNETSGFERAWLQYIVDIAYDRDGCRTIESLEELVDDIRSFAISALKGNPAPFPNAAITIKLNNENTKYLEKP